MRRPNLRAPIALTCLLLSIGATVHAATLTLPQYLAELQRLSSALASASAADAEALSVPLAPEWFVDLGDGGRARGDARWLVQGLRDARLAANWDQTRTLLRRRLDFQQAQAAELLGRESGEVTATSFRTAVAAVLAEEDLLHASEPDLIERIQRRVGAWLQALFSRFGAPVGGRTAAVIVAWTLGIAALAVFALWIVSMLRRAAPPAAIGLQHRREVASSREWASRWLAAVRGGDLSEAARCAYRAALRRLEEQGVWRIDESRTPREYRRAIAAGDARAPALAAIADAFERAIYARQVPSSDDVRRIGEGLENLGCLQPGDRAI